MSFPKTLEHGGSKDPRLFIFVLTGTTFNLLAIVWKSSKISTVAKCNKKWFYDISTTKFWI